MGDEVNGNWSYMPVLKHVCDLIRPVRILEWGPGRSTAALLELCPGGTILSIEHDAAHYGRAVHQFRDEDRVQLVWVEHSLDPGRARGYATYPLRHNVGPFDLVFVDGRSRVDCLVVAHLVLATGGAVILHDADRANYAQGIEFFQWHHVYKAERTAVLAPKPLQGLQESLEAQDVPEAGP